MNSVQLLLFISHAGTLEIIDTRYQAGSPAICRCDRVQEEENGTLKKASRIIASVVASRNSAFSGQTFFCLS